MLRGGKSFATTNRFASMGWQRFGRRRTRIPSGPRKTPCRRVPRLKSRRARAVKWSRRSTKSGTTHINKPIPPTNRSGPSFAGFHCQGLANARKIAPIAPNVRQALIRDSQSLPTSIEKVPAAFGRRWRARGEWTFREPAASTLNLSFRARRETSEAAAPGTRAGIWELRHDGLREGSPVSGYASYC